MTDLSVKDLLEAGCHFGHQTSRWNPKMKPYIFGVKNGVHIIDLDKTVEAANAASKFVASQVALGHSIVFVGTKRQAADIIREQAERVGQHYVSQRWLGGMLTNFKTIKQSIDRLQTLYKRREAGEFAKLTKKESLGFERDIASLENSLGGIKTMTRLPGAVFIIDPKTERIALHEAQRLKIPVIAVTDTNCDPDGIDFVIPGNDDAIRSISLIITHIADACAEGGTRREAILREESAAAAKDRPGAAAGAPTGGGRVHEKKMTGKARAYVAEHPSAGRGGRRPAQGGTHGGRDARRHDTRAKDPVKDVKKDGAAKAKETKETKGEVNV